MQCLEEEVIAGYARGSLAETLADEVIAHGSTCKSCSKLIQLAEQREDWARRALGSPVQGGPALGNPADRVIMNELASWGKVLDKRYRLKWQIGRGGMGEAYAASDLRYDGRDVVVKIILNDLAAAGRDELSWRRFERESKAVSQLQSPHIVKAFDRNLDGKPPYFVMERIRGLDGSKFLGATQVSPVTMIDFVRQACVGVHHIHIADGGGIVHRDIKPSNLMVTAEGHVVILDFGIALLNGESSLTESGEGMGTVGYSAPEQWDSAHSVDFRADLYSLGATLFAFLVGSPPNRLEPIPIAQKVRDALQRRPAEMQIPAAAEARLVGILERLLATERSQRDFASALQVAEELQCVIDDCKQPKNLPPAPPLLPQPSKNIPASIPLIATLLLTIALLLAGVIYVVTDNGTLQITTVDESVKVVVTKNGEQVEIIDLKTRKSATLRSGTYLLELDPKNSDLKLESSQLQMKRGKKTIVDIIRLDSQTPKPPPPPPLSLAGRVRVKTTGAVVCYQTQYTDAAFEYVPHGELGTIKQDAKSQDRCEVEWDNRNLKSCWIDRKHLEPIAAATK